MPKGRDAKFRHGKPMRPVDWEQVKKLAALHCTQTEICDFLEIDGNTLRVACAEVYGVYLKDKLEEWRSHGKISLRRNQFKQSEKNASMAIFLGKQYLGQTDDYGIAHKGDVKIDVVTYGSSTPKPWGGSTDGEESDQDSSI